MESSLPFHFKEKRAITLLEVLLAVMLILFSGTFIGFRIVEFWREQRLYDEMGEMRKKISLAEELMFLANVDSSLLIQRELEGFRIQLLPRSAIHEKEKALFGPPIRLETIDEIVFEDAFTGTRISGDIELYFLSRGFYTNRGTLMMSKSGAGRSIILDGSLRNRSLRPLREIYPYDKDLLETFSQVTEETAREIKEAKGG